MRLRVVAKAGYHYTARASASCIEARLLAASTPRQRVQSTSLECDPSGWKLPFIDYWGTPTVTVHLREDHTTLAVVGTSVLDLEASDTPHEHLSWDDLAADKVTDALAEFLDDSEAVSADLASAVTQLKRDGASPGDTARQLASRPGMDADVLLATLRRYGIPARFARGVRVDVDALAVGDTVDAESGVWVEFWDAVWQGLDPADGGPCGAGHIAMAFGRERSDVSPLRGIYSGQGHSECYQQITVKRLS
jgi:transglutaminase-like putative cysteine protease